MAAGGSASLWLFPAVRIAILAFLLTFLLSFLGGRKPASIGFARR
jgi:hypothetical protein